MASIYAEEKRAEMARTITRAFGSGALDLLHPWTFPRHPYNILSGKRYRGTNVFALWARMKELGTDDCRWITFDQALYELGTPVRKGEKRSPIINVSGKSNRPHYRHGVFSVVQLERELPGCSDAYGKHANHAKHEIRNRAIANCGVSISYGANEWGYYEAFDEIKMKDRATYDDSDEFFVNALHCVAHSMAHKDRMGWSKNYDLAHTELLAQLTFALLVSDVCWVAAKRDISRSLVSEHAVFFDRWLQILSEPATLTKLCHEAQAAYDMIMATTSKPVPLSKMPFALIPPSYEDISDEELNGLAISALCEGCGSADIDKGCCDLYDGRGMRSEISCCQEMLESILSRVWGVDPNEYCEKHCNSIDCDRDNYGEFICDDIASYEIINFHEEEYETLKRISIEEQGAYIE